MSQGAKSNATGRVLENTIRAILKDQGFEVVKYKDWENNKNNFPNELLLTNAPYTSIYGHQGKTEFLLISEKYNLKTRIECKWQQTAGSVDEKLPYLYLNCIESMPEEHIILVIDGDGWKNGAIDWIKRATTENKYVNLLGSGKKIEVMSLREILTWINNGFK